jgi:hypothetical protein
VQHLEAAADTHEETEHVRETKPPGVGEESEAQLVFRFERSWVWLDVRSAPVDHCSPWPPVESSGLPDPSAA